MGAIWAVAITLALASKIDTVVVCPDQFRSSLQPWVDYRNSQGHGCLVVPSDRSHMAIRTRIRELAKEHPIRFILLVGDADPVGAAQPNPQQRFTPTYHVEAKVNIKWGSEADIATDNWYADLDDDRVPDVAIGRLPVDSPAELDRLVKRIIAYESIPKGDWKQKINFIAGVGGFGALADSLLETTTRKFLTDGIPSSYDVSMTYGSWRSPFCPDPRKFHDAAVDRFNEGCLFWVYIGHGSPFGLDRVNTPGGQYHIFASPDTPRLGPISSPPIAMFLACYVGAFDLPRDCLAEEMLRADGGPIAILSGSRVTMPYGMAIFGDGLMKEYFFHRRETLGEVFLEAKKHLAKSSLGADPKAEQNRILLDALAKAISPDPELLDEERFEHLSLFNLLGDPLLKVPQPVSVTLNAPLSAKAGEKINIRGSCPVDGPCRIELVCRRDSFKANLPGRTKFDTHPMSLEEFSTIYAQANDRSWCTLDGICSNGEFDIELTIPAEAKGHCHARVTVESANGFGIGASDLFIHRKDGSK